MRPSALLRTCCLLQVGAAAAYVEHGVMPWARVAGLVLGAICVIAWLNLRCAATHATLPTTAGACDRNSVSVCCVVRYRTPSSGADVSVYVNSCNLVGLQVQPPSSAPWEGYILVANVLVAAIEDQCLGRYEHQWLPGGRLSEAVHTPIHLFG